MIIGLADALLPAGLWAAGLLVEAAAAAAVLARTCCLVCKAFALAMPAVAGSRLGCCCAIAMECSANTKNNICNFLIDLVISIFLRVA